MHEIKVFKLENENILVVSQLSVMTNDGEQIERLLKELTKIKPGETWELKQIK